MIEIISYTLSLLIICFLLNSINQTLKDISSNIKNLKLTQISNVTTQKQDKTHTLQQDTDDKIQIDLSSFETEKSKTEIKLNTQTKSESVSDDTLKNLDMLKRHKKNYEENK